MIFGTIGAGTISQALAELVSDLGPLATAGTVTDAARRDVVFLSVPFPEIPAALDGLCDQGGGILVDTTNVFTYSSSGTPEVLDLGEQTGSEITVAHAPGARVIKAFNTLYAKYIAPDPRHDAGRQIVFLGFPSVTCLPWFEGSGVEVEDSNCQHFARAHSPVLCDPDFVPSRRFGGQ